MEYISKFKGSEIDTELTYVKNTVRQKLPDVEMQLTELSAEVGGLSVEIITPTIEDGLMVISTGETTTNATSCATDYVYVGDAHSIVIEGAFTTYSRAIAAFDKNKTFVSAWEDYTNGEPLLIPSGVEYIRITGKAGVAPTVIKQVREVNKSRFELLRKGLNDVESEIQAIYGLVAEPIFSTLINWRYSISAGGWINEGSSILFDIEGRNKWIGKAGSSTYYAFLNSFDFDKNEGVFNEFTTAPTRWTTNKELRVAIPSGAKYLWIQLRSDSASPDDTPAYLIIDGIVCEFDGNASPKDNLSVKINDNSKKIDSLLTSKPIGASFLDFSDLIVCSHRGMSAVDCPENSLHSITTAAYQQMKIVECDVRYTADGVPVVLHDGTLNRTMNTINDEELSEDVRVSDITWDELSKGYIYKTSVEKYKTRICTFWEWMDRVKQLKLIPFLHWIDASLIGRVQQYVGDNFIYMGSLQKCKDVRKLAPNCFIMYQQASQQTSTGELTDIDAVITDMHAIGGLCGYSSMWYATFTDEFVDKLRKNGYYWQFSTDVPSYSTECIRRGVDFLLINNWCNNHLTYKPLFKVADDLSNVIYNSLENGCPVLEQDASIPLSLAIKGNNVRLHIVCKGQVKVIVDGKVSQFGNDEYFAAYECGVNTISSEIGVTIYARSRVVIEELYIEES